MVTPTGTVTELWRYPVKSLQGERLDRVEVTDAIIGDRAWGIIDTASGNLLSAKRYPELLAGSARMVDGVQGDDLRCEITLPDGFVVQDDDPDIDNRLSAWLGLAVRLTRPRPDESVTIEIEWDEGQDEPGELPVFGFPTTPGWFFDSSSSLHAISATTLAHLERQVGPGSGDVRRFRPNIVVSFDGAAGAEPFAEDALVERTVAFGPVQAWAKKRTDRCVVITRALPGVPATRDPLVWLARNHGRNAGISLQPRSVGTIATGDHVTVRD